MSLRALSALFAGLTLLAGCDSGATKDSGVPGKDSSTTAPPDEDGDGYAGADDCDDADPEVYVGAEERCDGFDQDCDGEVDDDPVDGTEWFADADADGYGAGAGVVACDAPAGTADADQDCDDTDPDRHPGAAETDCSDPTDYNCDGSVGYADADGDGVAACDDCDDADATLTSSTVESCNGLDDDCNGVVDDAADAPIWHADTDGDGYGVSPGAASCETPAGSAAIGGDCDDLDPARHPDAVEEDCADPNDYNCDGSVGYADADGDGVAACEDCDDTDAAVNPAGVELCNGRDDDCSGTADDDAADAPIWYFDADVDSWGDDAASVTSCEAPAGYVASASDCDDADAAFHPGADETDCTDPNDYNCDSSVGYADVDGDGTAACSDCDDDDAAAHPGATEACNGADDDCDGETDEADAVDAAIWYADADADGYGDAGSIAVACDAPAGYLADTSDCDDADPAVSPGAAEVCDAADVDEDCSGAADDSDPGVTEQSTFYADLDGDDYGDVSVARAACSPTAGEVGDNTDCDDADATINPGEVEVCDSLDTDEDCSGSADDADPGVTEQATFYADLDGDNYGDVSVARVACSPAAAEVGDNTDCDDADSDTFPGAASLDDTTACMRDADGDGYGDAAASSPVVSGADCDDEEATVYPGAAEDGGDGTDAGDGLDNDCDGYADEALLYGSGADGPGTVAADADWSALGGVCTAVTALSAGSATVADAGALARGDKVLVVNLQGAAGATSQLGAWEILDVSGVSGSVVSFLDPVVGTYGVTSSADLSGQAVALFRVPQLSSLAVAAGATLSAPPFDGACGGVLPLLVSGATTIDGAVSMDAGGYAGGDQNVDYNTTGQGGESYAGEANKTYAANLGGGGGGGLAVSSCLNCEGTGGGGGHGEDGEDGEQSNPLLGYGGVGGTAYGDVDLVAFTLGSGGGAGALDYPAEAGIGGSGGAGGGAVLLRSGSLVISGVVSADGEDGEVGCAELTNWCGTAASYASEAEPGGGGAGGVVYLVSASMTSVAGGVSAVGGFGQLSGSTWLRTSGDGGVGRVRLDVASLNGLAPGAAAVEATTVCDPAPGSFQAP